MVAGNVETSQAVTDACSARSARSAAAQGTMNNLNFGNARYQYYETICSGAPAGPGFDGTDAVHTHMTNSRLTDPEVLEMPLSRWCSKISTSAAAPAARGRWNAGDGTLRRIRFREPMELALLTDRRRVRSFGMEGGEPGELGRNIVRRNDGRREELPGCAQTVLEAGEAIEIVTPTGGGWGKKSVIPSPASGRRGLRPRRRRRALPLSAASR